ncbi:hypothetical protein [Undibacterium pigrum]|uniref:hypothetical protein n=1 Tax=Undibacterium pigrum TaxID=401470 RepID=UPI000D75D3DB|nr:hypothetical protein [Undibacterium pigrum]
MSKKSATILGFIFAPLIAALMIALRSPIFSLQDFTAYGLILFFYFFTLITTILLGVPAFLLLDHFKLVTWWSTVGVGTVIGGLVGILIRLPSVPHLNDLLPMTPIGTVSACVFWLIWRTAQEPV